MRSGKLRKQVRFDSEVSTADGAGGFTRTWTVIATVWGEYLPERGREQMERGHLEPVNVAILRVRYSSQLAGIVMQNSRCVIENGAHNIRSIIDPDGRRRMLEMVIELGVPPFG